jgi:hypothetical protein
MVEFKKDIFIFENFRETYFRITWDQEKREMFIIRDTFIKEFVFDSSESFIALKEEDTCYLGCRSYI